jgi:hypothetical protein
LALNFWQTTGNLDTGYLAGHEFRQSQTALSILFIQREENYSLAYPTPVFGPPWSIPMEFPLYQWAAAKLATEAELGIPRAARMVSLFCFYAALPGLLILLRRFGAHLQTAFLALALVLMAPIYIYYSRAVLIESMALFLSVWFLVAFDVVRRRQSWIATIATAIFGGLAALVKITTFAVWGGIALALGIHEIVQLTKNKAPAERTKFMVQAALAGMVPLVLGVAWIRYADAIKAGSPGGFFLTSDNLESFNLGSIADRLNPQLWQDIFSHALVGMMPLLGWLLLLIFLALPTAKSRPRVAIWTSVAALAVWASFPNLYQIHDYYLYAMGVLPLGALALAMQRFATLRRWFWLPAAVTVLIGGLQWRSFAAEYLPFQRVVSNGGSPLFDFIRDATRSDDLLVVVGNDWSATIPYYTQRRAVMIKLDIHDQPEILEPLLNSIESYPIAGLLILEGGPPRLAQTAAQIVEKLGLESAPTFRLGGKIFHSHQDLRTRMQLHLLNYNQYQGVESLHEIVSVQQTDPIIADLEVHPVTPNQSDSLFYRIKPRPERYRVEFGLNLGSIGNDVVLGAHADTDLWMAWKADRAFFEVEFGLTPYINEDIDNRSDGVWFRVWGVTADDSAEELIWERWIDPWHNEHERGVLQETFEAETARFTAFRFATRAGPSKAYDSAFWGGINVRP